MRRRPIRRKGATIGTCKIGKFNTSEDEVEHWEHVIASKDQCISQWHKFYPIPLTMPPGKSSAVSKTNQIETPMTD
uniref:Uncharacterized protein n=1 Tax=Trichobilharzia regenti TaxID=157069 RepID=A0AA85JMW1_TRIRE|nr:unnamed protein product [Trichobilharzia regenti]